MHKDNGENAANIDKDNKNKPEEKPQAEASGEAAVSGADETDAQESEAADITADAEQPEAEPQQEDEPIPADEQAEDETATEESVDDDTEQAADKKESVDDIDEETEEEPSDAGTDIEDTPADAEEDASLEETEDTDDDESVPEEIAETDDFTEEAGEDVVEAIEEGDTEIEEAAAETLSDSTDAEPQEAEETEPETGEAEEAAEVTSTTVEETEGSPYKAKQAQTIHTAEAGETAIGTIAQPTVEYTMWGFGLVCICSELVWFYGSKWFIAIAKSLGMGGVTAHYVVAVLWFPITMFVIPYLYMHIKGIDQEKFVGLSGTFKKLDIAIVALSAFAVWALMRIPEMYWTQLVNYIFDGDLPHISGIGAYDTVFWIDFIRKCIIPAFFEEYLYRGVVYRSLRGGIGAKRAALLSSVIFMLMHTDLTNVVAPLALGLLCSYLLETTGSIFPCMLSHFIYNTSSTIGNMGVAARDAGAALQWPAYSSILMPALMVLSCTVLLVMCLYMVRRGGRYKGSVGAGEYAICKRKPLDILPYYFICFILVAGYFF